MKVERIVTDIGVFYDRIKRTITKTLVDEATQKTYRSVETYYETYDKNGKIKTEEKHSVDSKV